MDAETKGPIQSVSFSLIKDFEACPYRVYLSHVEKAPQPDHSDDPKHPLVRGDRVHKEAEAYIRGEGPLTKDLRKFEQRLTELAERYAEGRVEVERKWAFDEHWDPCDWHNGVVRMITDVTEHLDDETKGLRTTDWKAGKSFNKDVEHTQQRQIYAIGAFMRYPHIQFVEVTHAYLDEGKEKTSRYTRANLPHLLPSWQKRIDRIRGALTFQPKANRGNCRFCDFGVNVGTGACPYAVPYE